MKITSYKFNIAGLFMVAFPLIIVGRRQSQSNCVPDNLNATNITTHTVNLAWAGIQGPTHARYYPTGTTDYEVRETHMNHICLHNLNANTPYSWELSNLCNGEWTPYIGDGAFTTISGLNITGIINADGQSERDLFAAITKRQRNQKHQTYQRIKENNRKNCWL